MSDPMIEVYKAKQQLGTELVKSLLLVNGGAVVVLLAFLQELWKDTATNHDMLIAMLAGMACFTVGLAAAIPTNWIRIYDKSTLVNICFTVSMAAFVFGSGVVIFFAMRAL